MKRRRYYIRITHQKSLKMVISEGKANWGLDDDLSEGVGKYPIVLSDRAQIRHR